jgi:hypothetical protein
MLSKEVTKSLLKKSQKAVTGTHICRLFTDKSCIKVLQKASQNCDDRLKLTFIGHCDQIRYSGYPLRNLQDLYYTIHFIGNHLCSLFCLPCFHCPWLIFFGFCFFMHCKNKCLPKQTFWTFARSQSQFKAIKNRKRVKLKPRKGLMSVRIISFILTQVERIV